MRRVSQLQTDIWKSGDFTGPRRPVARVTIQRTDFITKDFRDQRYASYLFGNPHPVIELPNVREVAWSRSVETDAGSCKITLWNATPRKLGERPDVKDRVADQLGFYTFNRGDEPNPWNHVKNYMNHRIYPDMLVRTYEGNGCDPDTSPEEDLNQYQSGVWLIDDVQLDATGEIVLNCRDASRLLLDQIIFPPVIPFAQYPLEFSHYRKVDNPPVPHVSTTNSKGWVRLAYSSDSGVPYNGKNGSIYGHRPTDAMDNDTGSYWLSIGNNSPTADYSYEYVQGKLDSPTMISGVRVKTQGGPYRCYVSVMVGGEWKGHGKIPYNPNDPVSAPNGADIKYVKSAQVRRNDTTEIGFTGIDNATHVRITFHDLWNSGVGVYPYRAAVKDFQVLTGESTTKTTYSDGGYHWKGNYSDYTDIVKWLLAYGGFFWPAQNSLNWIMDTAGHRDHWDPVADPVLFQENPDDTHDLVKRGREIGALWADLEQTGTYGDVELTPDVFDKKPLMDGIGYIRDLTGMIFYVDETGAAIMRSPNVWKKGNWYINPRTARTVGRKDPGNTSTSDEWVVTIHEKQTLMGLQAQLSSRNVRERIVIANAAGDKGAVTRGYRPYNMPRNGLRRVAIWSDQHFKTNAYCQVMADLIAVRAMFTYRTDRITIPGYPALQVDDQVKLVEDTTEENRDLHYIKGISSTLSHDTGEWTYEIDTHWLGNETFSDWAFDPEKMSPETKAYLRSLGRVN